VYSIDKYDSRGGFEPKGLRTDRNGAPVGRGAAEDRCIYSLNQHYYNSKTDQNLVKHKCWNNVV